LDLGFELKTTFTVSSKSICAPFPIFGKLLLPMQKNPLVGIRLFFLFLNTQWMVDFTLMAVVKSGSLNFMMKIFMLFGTKHR